MRLPYHDGTRTCAFPSIFETWKESEIFVRTDEVQETVKNYKIKNKIREQLNKKDVFGVCIQIELTS